MLIVADGKTEEELIKELKAKGLCEEDIKIVIEHIKQLSGEE